MKPRLVSLEPLASGPSGWPESILKLDTRPIIVALAGPNGAGKTTFYEVYLRETALRFLNADRSAGELQIDSYRAARMLAALRQELVRRRESFIFETVFSDPVGDKLAFLRDAAQSGYTVVVCFIGLAHPKLSQERVAIRVAQGGHDVPNEKLVSRFPRTLANLHAAIRELPHVLIFDNSDLDAPFRPVAAFEAGRCSYLNKPAPRWLRRLLR